MDKHIFFSCVKDTTRTSDIMPNGSQKDNEATSFVGQQYSMQFASKIAVGLARYGV